MIRINTLDPAAAASYVSMSKSPSQLREASVHDLPFWIELASDAVVQRHLPGLRLPTSEALLNYLLERNSFTAYIDGVPVGGAFMSVFDTAPGALVVDVLVHRNYRDARVGPRIIREVESHARKLGAQRIRSILTQDNRHALSYFESCGYSKVIMLEKDIKEAA